MSVQFVHLRVHSEFSLVDGITRIKPLIQSAVSQKMPALAITDQSFMCAQIRFYQSAQQNGLKPLCGCDVWLEHKELQSPARITILCMNETGYRNLMELVSMAFQHNQHHGHALCKREWILEKNEGLIILSGAREGDVGMALLGTQPEQARPLIEKWQQVFGNRYYLEVQRTGRTGEETYLQAVLPLAASMRCPVVATNEVMFMNREDFDAHEARVCIGEGHLLDDPRRAKRYSEEQYFKSADEMAALFKDIPEAIENTVEIAKRCNVHIPLGKPFLPDFPVPEHLTIEQFFRQSAQKGLEERISRISGHESEAFPSKRQEYEKRLEFELDIIEQMGFPGYFLIVMDFIQWAKNNGIPVGPGRGSGAGSLVAYALKITDLDPLEYDLLFERFLNPERVSMPDFDIDFCMENRDRVIEYVSATYGSQAVSQIITFGTMAAKAVVRDVARVQGKSYSMADKLSKLIPFEIGMTLEKAREQEENLKEFLDSDSDAREVWEMALKLEGITRNVGKHAGGVVIAPRRLTDFSPLYCDENGHGLVTQYDKNDVESAGLVKFDFLGLRTLTIIDWALEMINPRQKQKNLPPVSIEKIDLADSACYTLLESGNTTAVFQLESRGMKDLIKRLKPDCFEDIIALVALFRPGPLQSGMVDNFINRKHGREQVSYPDAQYQHESLKPILDSTYGIILYQEQVMQIAQVMAGYTLGEADLLRRAMGKKKPEEMERQRDVFQQGAKNQGVDPELAMKIFDLVEKFAGYGFNKSHSAAYALVSYQTLWLKTHFPSEFMAAVLSSDMQNTDKVVSLIEECRRMDITVQPPRINSGKFMFDASENGDIIYGLGSIKGVGEGPVELIVSAREKDGPFRNLFDFCERVNTRKINKRCMEALIRSGALDEIAPPCEDLDLSRAILLASLDDAVKAAEQSAQNLQAGFADLFGSLTEAENENNDVYDKYHTTTALTDRERLQGEKDTLGLYLTGHPLDEYRQEIGKFTPHKIRDLQPSRNTTKIAGLIVAVRIIRNRRGDKMGFITLDDGSGRIEAAIFNEVFTAHQSKLAKDSIVVIEGEVNHDDYSGLLKVAVRNIMTVGEARNEYASGISISVDAETISDNFSDSLARCLKSYPGNLPVQIRYSNDKASANLWLSQEYNLEPMDECIADLEKIIGKNNISIMYKT